MTGRSVLVTGAAGGLGGATTRLLADRGWQVFAGDLAGEALERCAQHPGVVPVVLDVTDRDSVSDAVETVSAQVDGLDGVVNFAGILAVGSVIEVAERDLARVLDVNVLGTFRVNQSFFPLVLARRGRVVNISSETGQQAGAPFNGVYAMSKHAIEAYSDSLRRELSLLGVTVVKIQPGPFRTPMVASIERQFTAAAEASTHFGPVLRRLLSLALREHEKAHDPAVLAEVVHQALITGRPRAAYPVRQDRGRRLLDRLPTRWSDAILRRALSS